MTDSPIFLTEDDSRHNNFPHSTQFSPLERDLYSRIENKTNYFYEYDINSNYVGEDDYAWDVIHKDGNVIQRRRDGVVEIVKKQDNEYDSFLISPFLSTNAMKALNTEAEEFIKYA